MSLINHNVSRGIKINLKVIKIKQILLPGLWSWMASWRSFRSCLLKFFLILLMVRDCSWQFQAVTDKKALKFPHGTSKLSHLMSGASLEFKSWSLTLLGKINISFLIYIIKKIISRVFPPFSRFCYQSWRLSTRCLLSGEK